MSSRKSYNVSTCSVKSLSVYLSEKTPQAWQRPGTERRKATQEMTVEQIKGSHIWFLTRQNRTLTETLRQLVMISRAQSVQLRGDESSIGGLDIIWVVTIRGALLASSRQRIVMMLNILQSREQLSPTKNFTTK